MRSDDGQSVVDMNCPMDDVWPRADLSHLNVDLSQLHEHSSLFGRAAPGYHFHSAKTCMPNRV